jgi:hypothetical protein
MPFSAEYSSPANGSSNPGSRASWGSARRRCARHWRYRGSAEPHAQKFNLNFSTIFDTRQTGQLVIVALIQ